RLQEVASYIGVTKTIAAPTTRLPVDDSNPFFLRDPAKCVLCGICVRTCRDLVGANAIDFSGCGQETGISAGGHSAIVDSRCVSCGECVERCPTGALIRRDQAAPAREVKSVCTFCGVGCSLFLGVRGDQVVSVRGDERSPVNEGMLCVKGRFGFSFIHSPERLKTPLVRRGGRRDAELVPASWDEALDLVAASLKKHKGDQFAAISSSRCTNEENYLMQKFARVVMETNNVDNCARLCHAPTVSGLSKSFGHGGGTNPLKDLDEASCIFVIGSNATEAHPVAGNRVRAAAKNATLIVADPRRIDLCENADLWLQLKPGTDVALLLGIAKVILDEGLEDRSFIESRCEGYEDFRKSVETFDVATAAAITGVPVEKIMQAARLYAASRHSIIVYSLGITEHSHGTDNVQAIANLAMLTGNVGRPGAGVMPMRGQNNVQGACDMGCVPASYPGSQSVTKTEIRSKFEQAWARKLPELAGLTVVEMLQAAEKGEVKAFYIMGMDVAYSVADGKRTREALNSADFVVVQDIFLTGTAKMADVVLPAASFAEKDGTFTNLERRLQRVRQAISPVGESRPDWWIVGELARRMGGSGFEYSDPAQIMDEMARLTPTFAGMSFARLESDGLQWPCPAPGHPGTPRLHEERFNTSTGKGRFASLLYRPSVETTDAKYPILLTTGRSIYHFHLAMTSQVPGLMDLETGESIRLHPNTAASLGIRNGEVVRVVSRRGELLVPANLTDTVMPDSAYMTFHFYETPTNDLTHQDVLDPVSKTPEFKVTAVRIEKLEGP
ncbi:MAG: formate dehydrogenase subunit alpha, partial [Bdellovibrionales bacterium GWB1_55_8]